VETTRDEMPARWLPWRMPAMNPCDVPQCALKKCTLHPALFDSEELSEAQTDH